jgi:16S rRNA (guanine527-N7)-methyltransferase
MPTVEFNQLAEVVSSHDMQLPDSQIRQLARYCELLWDWNERINLTRHTTLEKFVTRDLVDTMQLAQLIDQEEAVLDVGSGGGVPGILLGIVRPDLKIALSESVGKKARVLENLVEELDALFAVHH